MASPITWTNWVGNQPFTPREIVDATTEDAVQRWVAHAVAHGTGVRTAGTGHSFTPIVQTDGLLLNMERMRGIVRIDADGHCSSDRNVHPRIGVNLRE